MAKLSKYNKEQVKEWHNDYLNGMGKMKITNKYHIDSRTIEII